MKNFKIKKVKMGQTSNLKLKLKIYNLILTKKLQNMFNIKNYKLIFSGFIIAIIGILSLLNLTGTNNLASNNNQNFSNSINKVIEFKKKQITLNKQKNEKYSKYRAYAMVRKNSLY